MMNKFLLLWISFSMCAWRARAAISGPLPSGSCICITGSVVNVRSSACGGVLGQAERDECFTHTGLNKGCYLGSTQYTFYELDYNGRNGHVAGTLLDHKPDSYCSSSGACYCVTGNGVNVRDSACGSVIGQANKDQCFKHNGEENGCYLGNTFYTFYGLDYNGQVGHIASSLLSESSSSSCDNHDRCLNCICAVESGDGVTPKCGNLASRSCGGMSGCVWDVNSCSCGPFQIKKDYFTDCSGFASVPINDWHGCATDENCAKKCVENYMKRYGKHCTGKAAYKDLTCLEIAGMHNGGPRGCYSSSTDGYRQKVAKCL